MMLTWYNVVMTFVIGLFTIAVIGEKDKDAKAFYANILIVSLVGFFILHFFEWSL